MSNAASLSAGQRAEAVLTRARMLARLGRTADAERDLEQSEQLLATVQSDALRARFSRASLLASAEVRTSSDPARAVRDAGHAVALIAKSGEPMRLAEASLLESRALAKLERIDEARVAAERGIDAFERALASIDPRDPIRISALDPVWALYSDAARLHLVRGREDHAAAFALLERGRARTLIDLRRVTPLSLADVQERLKSDEALLLLDQSSSSLVTWWITAASVRTASANASVDHSTQSTAPPTQPKAAASLDLYFVGGTAFRKNGSAVNQKGYAAQYRIGGGEPKKLSDVAILQVRAESIAMNGVGSTPLAVPPDRQLALYVVAGPDFMHRAPTFRQISHALLLKTIYDVKEAKDDEIMPTSATDVEAEKVAVQRHPCDFGTPSPATPQRRVLSFGGLVPSPAFFHPAPEACVISMYFKGSFSCAQVGTDWLFSTAVLKNFNCRRSNDPTPIRCSRPSNHPTAVSLPLPTASGLCHTGRLCKS